MGKNKAPSYNPPKPTERISGQELFSQGTGFAKSNTPFAFSAREQALQDVNDPNYYAKFQPTSFEQALGNQYFQNIFPNQEAILKNQYSRTGMADSPVLGDALSRAYGKTAYDVGTYLSDLGNQRALNSLNYRNIDPINSLIMPYVTTSANQSNMNASAMDAYNQAVAETEYQNAMNKYNNKMAFTKMMGQISPITGAIYGGVTGGGQGLAQSLSGSLDTASMLLPAIASGGSAGGLSAFSTSGMNKIGQSRSVNPSGSNGVNFVNNNMDLGQYLGTGKYNTVNPFAISMSGAVNDYPIIWN